MYSITGTSAIKGLGALSLRANDIPDALRKARAQIQRGLVDVSISDNAGHKIEGKDLEACIEGKKTLSDDLRAI